jgi:hypothetical protein
LALYEVTNVADKSVRLIEAKTKAGARSFAAKNEIEVIKATPSRVHTLAARGVELETALEEKE